MILVLTSIKYFFKGSHHEQFNSQLSWTHKLIHLLYPHRIVPSGATPLYLFDVRIEGRIGQIGRFPRIPHINFLPPYLSGVGHFILLDTRLLNFDIIFDHEAVDISMRLRFRLVNGFLVVFLGWRWNQAPRNLVVCRDGVVVGAISARLAWHDLWVSLRIFYHVLLLFFRGRSGIGSN